jgi:hypothetical protein
LEEFHWAKAVEPAEAKRRDDELLAARRRLQSTAMMAGLPRDLIEVYDHVALAAYQSSKDSLRRGLEATIPGVIGDCVTAAFGLICDLLWRPLLARITYRRRFRQLKAMISEARKTDEGRNLTWLYGQP